MVSVLLGRRERGFFLCFFDKAASQSRFLYTASPRVVLLVLLLLCCRQLAYVHLIFSSCFSSPEVFFLDKKLNRGEGGQKEMGYFFCC